MAISPNGRYVVGYFNPGGFGFDRGFWFDMDTHAFHILPFPGDNYQSSYCNDVNDSGLIVGSLWYTIGPAVQRGYVFDVNSGQFVTQLMPLPGAAHAEATGINNSGQVCGTRSIGSKGDPTTPRTAFLWSAADGFTDLGVMSGPSSLAFNIDDDGTVVGLTGGNVVSLHSRAFVWRNGTNTVLPPVPSGYNSAAFASNGPNRIIVSGLTQVNGTTYPRGWALFDGLYFDLGFLVGHEFVFPRATDASGQVFGWCTNSNVDAEAFVWRDGTIHNLAEFVQSTTAFIQQATAVSRTGLVAGVGTNSRGDPIAIVLEPEFPREGDINCDGVVNVRDLLGVILKWGPCYGCSTDFNGDGDVGYEDILTAISNWG